MQADHANAVIYLGTKEIRATPMSKEVFESFKNEPFDFKTGNWRGEELDIPGYLVEYLDGGQANYPEFSPYYVSWSPADVFERAYIPNGKLPLWAAIKYISEGRHVRDLSGRFLNGEWFSLETFKLAECVFNVPIDAAVVPLDGHALKGTWEVYIGEGTPS